MVIGNFPKETELPPKLFCTPKLSIAPDLINTFVLISQEVKF